MTTILSANRPEAHRLEVKSTAAPVLRRAVINWASLTSLICEVASSSSRIDPIKHFLTVSGEESWFSFPDISCASVLVRITLVQSDGDRGCDGGRKEDGFSSSSFALTTVESLEGSRDTSFFWSPVIC